MRVVSLWRYPVKSMQGEELETAHDRRPRHRRRPPVGARRPRHRPRPDRPAGARAAVRLRPGSSATATTSRSSCPTAPSPTDDAALSAWLGRDVELRRAGAGVTGRFEIAADFEDEAGSPWFQWDGPTARSTTPGKTRVSVARHRLDRRVGPPPVPRQRARRDRRRRRRGGARRPPRRARHRPCSTSSSRSTAA